MLNNLNELALVFWRNADNAVALSLIGCNLYEKMILTLPLYDTEGQLALANQKAHLEQTAKMMVELLYSKSRVRHAAPLCYFSPFLGNGSDSQWQYNAKAEQEKG